MFKIVSGEYTQELLVWKDLKYWTFSDMAYIKLTKKNRGNLPGIDNSKMKWTLKGDQKNSKWSLNSCCFLRKMERPFHSIALLENILHWWWTKINPV